MIVPTKIFICVTPEDKMLGKSFLKKNFALLLNLVLNSIEGL